MKYEFHDPVVKQCLGCKHVRHIFWFPSCNMYLKPASWFRNGNVCPKIYNEKEYEETKRVGQQKQNKAYGGKAK